MDRVRAKKILLRDGDGDDPGNHDGNYDDDHDGDEEYNNSA